MADIKFLAGLDIDGNIDLNKGQLQAAVIHPLASNPSSPSVGQLYYNTGDDELKVYTSGGWIAVGADTDNYVDDGFYNASTGIITLERTGSLGNIDISGLLQIGTTSTTALAGNTTTISAQQASDISDNNDKVSFPGFGTTAGTALEGDTTTISSQQASDILTNNNKTSFPGFGTTAGKALEGNTSLFVAKAGDTMTGNLNIANDNAKIVLGNTGATNTSNRIEGIGETGKTFIQFGYNENDGGDEFQRIALSYNGGGGDYIFLSANVEEENLPADGIKSGSIKIGSSTTNFVMDNIYLNAFDTRVSGRLQVLGTGQSSFTGQVTIPETPAAASDAASKAYVDSVVTGQLIYQGGYDASIAPPTGSSILKGFTYTVTASGDGNGFFTTELEVGDLIIAESNNPTTETDWTEVNKNVDLATTSSVGVASFSSSNFAVSSAGQVTVKNNGIALGTETTGNYVASVSGSTNVTVSGGTGEGSTPSISVPNSNIDARITNRQYAGLIGGSTSVTIAASTHGLGSDSSQFMVQLVEVSSGETVHAEVTRGASGAVTIAFTTAPSANAIRVLINKIG
jgi:hypothetical protein